MIVQHNLQAMNANRMLGISTSGQSKATEKLSSGYKINRAADDAAGLSISEKMRKQIRGLSRASTNAQDGISAVQTAEGALTEVHSMLQRMNELAVQAANGTMSEDDRQSVQDEIDQLVDEIDRVAETTKFNETYLLKGTNEQTTTETVTTSKATFEITTQGEFKESYILNTGAEYYATDKDGNTTKLDDSMDAETLAKYINADGSAKDGYVIYKTDANTTDEYGAQVSSDQADAATVAASLTTTTSGLMTQDGKAVTKADLATYFDEETGVYKGGLYSTKTDGTITEIGAEQISKFVTVTVETSDPKEVTTKTADPLVFSLHVGAESADTNKITLSIEAMSADGIGIKGLKGEGLKTQQSATNAIDTISDAIKQVSTQRSALGAVQNRLEHTIANLDNVVENTTDAESRIRDTDMAESMVEYSKNNILIQAGQSMLAQANQSTQGVLSLLG